MAWNQTEKLNWYREQVVKRSYQKEVVDKILSLQQEFDILQYGRLSINPDLYPLFLIRTKNHNKAKKTILITGGVHGYETSGVHGAIGFFERSAAKYSARFNLVCAPCISPWAYETINRWNAKAIDPNRSFFKNSPAEECQLFLDAMEANDIKPFAHFDLHETTDTDNTIFRPALAARDGTAQDFSEIPDGFYLVGDTQNPKMEFQKAIIDSVRKVTHIAPSDDKGRLIGVPIEQEGVVNYDVKKLFLCAGFSDAEFTTTTEVYPDSPKANDEICIAAQIAAIEGGLEHLLK
jgi:hypothetical protein